MLLKKSGNGNNKDIICIHNHNIDQQHKDVRIYRASSTENKQIIHI